jgi:LysM repeat protein
MSMQCPPGTFTYVIRSGDNFYRLAPRFNTTVDAIVAANPGVNPNALQIGQTVCIPGTAPTPAGCPAGSTSYVIRAGDTLYAIAQRYNTTVNEIIAINPGINPNALRIGQTVCIPGTPPLPSTCPAGTFSYVIRAGDTLGQIGRRFNVSLSDIIAVNPGLNPSNLQIGMVICIPEPGTCPSGDSYTVRPGDTFYSIALKFNVSLDALLAANPFVNPDRLYVGQQICVPPAVACPGNRSHVILPGETLTSIAEKYVVRVRDILAANPGLQPRDYVPGRRICIPLEEAPV